MENNIITFLLSLFGGGGIGYTAVRLFMQDEAKKALKGDLIEIKDNIKELENSVNNKFHDIATDYVTCKFCNMQHENLSVLLKSMNSKLDILIEKGNK